MRRSPALLAGALIVSLAPAAIAQETGATIIPLDRALRLAKEHHPGLKAAAEGVRQAEILRWRAWAILLPYVFVDGSITRNDKEVGLAFPDFVGMIDAVVAQRLGEQPAAPMGAGESTIIQELWGQRWGFTANIALFNAQAIPLLRSAYDNIDAARLQQRHTQSQLLFAVTASYYAAHMAAEGVRIGEEDVRTAKEFLRLAERRKAAGMGVGLDVLKAELAVAQREKVVADAQDQERLAKASLAYLSGIEGTFVTAAPPRPETGPLVLPDLQRRAWDERLDLKATRIMAGIGERDRTHTWTKFAPSFDVTYNYTWDSATGFAGEHDSWRLILGARWSLLEGGQRFAELDEKASRIRQTYHELGALSLSVEEEVEKAVVAMKGRQRNLELVARQVALAQESHKQVSGQYALGRSNGVELLDATTTLAQSRRAQLLERLQHDLALLGLQRAIGREFRAE